MPDALYDRAYFERYEATFADPGIHYGIATAIHRAFPDAVSVVEIGYGRGYLTRHLGNLYGDNNVMGFDASEWAVANPVEPGLLLHRANLGEAPSGFRPWIGFGDIGLVLSWQVLEHVDMERLDLALAQLVGFRAFAHVHSIRLAGKPEGEDSTHVNLRTRHEWLVDFAEHSLHVEPAWQAALEREGNWIGNPEIFALRRS